MCTRPPSAVLLFIQPKVLTREHVSHSVAAYRVNQGICSRSGSFEEHSDSLIEGVRQRLHGVEWNQAVVSSGEHGALPHVVLPCVPHHQQVILFERQLLFVVLILLASCE